MRRSLVVVTGVSLLAVSSLTLAQTKDGRSAPPPAAAPAGGPPAGGAPPPEPGPAKPGPETLALKPLAGTRVMTGTVKANAMGPGSPEMPSKGKHTCKWFMNNLWLQCDIEDAMGAGGKTMKWIGHVILGWDFEARAYRATLVDNMGNLSMMSGKLEGTKLALETVSANTMMGQPVKERITFDWADAKAWKFTDERQLGKSAPWQLVEEGTMKPGK